MSEQEWTVERVEDGGFVLARRGLTKWYSTDSLVGLYEAIGRSLREHRVLCGNCGCVQDAARIHHPNNLGSCVISTLTMDAAPSGRDDAEGTT